MQDKIRQLISEGQLEEALKLMEPYAPDDVVLQRGRLAALNRQNNMGLLDFDDFSRKQNQISVAALELLRKVPRGGPSAAPSGAGANTSDAGAAPTPLAATDTAQSIYFSYAWGDDQEAGESREEIVNQLYEALKADGFALKRDKMDLEYRGLISEFMKDIGRSGLIVVAISDKYLRSPYCMHELNEIYRNSRQEKEEFSKRVFPIRAESIKMSDPLVLDSYLEYWEEQETKWKSLVQKRAGQLGPSHFGEFDKVREINSNFSQLLAFLQDMNSMTKRLLAQDDFAPVKEAIRQRLSELAG